MYVLYETVFEDWVTFQYHDDMRLRMKLQDLITINLSIINTTAK